MIGTIIFLKEDNADSINNENASSIRVDYKADMSLEIIGTILFITFTIISIFAFNWITLYSIEAFLISAFISFPHQSFSIN
jgi:hypothetical protein